MTKPRQLLSFNEAVELLIEAKVVESKFSVGTNRDATEIVIPAGGIDCDKNRLFKRSDVCRLIGYARLGD